MSKRNIAITRAIDNVRIGNMGLSFSYKSGFITIYENFQKRLVYLQKAKVGDIFEFEFHDGVLDDVNRAVIPTEWNSLIRWLLHIEHRSLINDSEQYLNFTSEIKTSYDYYDQIDDMEEKQILDDTIKRVRGVSYAESELIESVSAFKNIRILINRKKGTHKTTTLAAYIGRPSRLELYDFMKRISAVSFLPYGIYSYILDDKNQYANEPIVEDVLFLKQILESMR